MPPMTLISIGLTVPIETGITYAIPDCKVTLITPGTVQYSTTLGGTYNNYVSPAVIRWGFVKTLANTTVKLKKVPWV